MKAPLGGSFSAKGSLKLNHPFVSLSSGPCLRIPKSTEFFLKLANKNQVITWFCVMQLPAVNSCYRLIDSICFNIQSGLSDTDTTRVAFCGSSCRGVRISLPNCCTVRAEPHWAVRHFFVGRLRVSTMFKTFGFKMIVYVQKSAKLWTVKKEVETQSWFPCVGPFLKVMPLPLHIPYKEESGLPRWNYPRSRRSQEPFLGGEIAVFDMV